MEAAAEAFRELILPAMGMETMTSQFFRTSWLMPTPSLPMTMAAGPFRSWNVAKVRDFSRMFCGALRFNHNLDSWAVDTNAILLNDIDDDKPFHAAFFESPLQQNPPKWYLPYIDSLFEPKTRQYIPKNEDELCDLVAFERVNLGDIDTSLIMDLQWLCMYLKRRKDFSGIERWSINEKCHISRALFDDCLLSDNPPKWFKDRFA